MKQFLNDNEVDWALVRKSVQQLAELDLFLRLNADGQILRENAVDSIFSIFKPVIFGIANIPRDFKVYRIPIQELLEQELLVCLKAAVKKSEVLHIESIQSHLINYLESENLGEDVSEYVETSDPISYSEETWRLIHLENGLTEVEGIQCFLQRVLSSKKLSVEKEISAAMDIEVGQLAQEFLRKNTRISEQDNRDLQQLISNGDNAFDLMFESSLSQLLGFAVYYRCRGLSILELIQEGSLGLIRAIQKYDYGKGYRFSTYAIWWIRQSMTRAIADNNSLIRVPVHRYEEIRKVLEIMKDLGIENISQKFEPWEQAYLLEELEIDEQHFREICKSIWQLESIELFIDVDGELIVDAREQSGFDLSAIDSYYFYEVQEFESHIQAVLNSITDREKWIIQLRYGFYGYPKTLQEIGEAFDLTRERIRQIESKTMSKLRHPSRSEVLKDYLDTDIWQESFQQNLTRKPAFVLPKELQD